MFWLLVNRRISWQWLVACVHNEFWLFLQKLDEVKKETDSEVKVKKEYVSSDDEPADKKKKSSSVKVKKEQDDDDVDEPIESTPPTSEDEASGSGSESDWAALRNKMVTWIALSGLNTKAVIAVLNTKQLCHNKIFTVFEESHGICFMSVH